jgi:hypothetical protein
MKQVPHKLQVEDVHSFVFPLPLHHHVTNV